MENSNKIMFNLKCPPGVSKEDGYLSLIKFLVDELRKFTEVEIVNEDILTNWQLEKEAQSAEILARTYQQKADLLRKKKEEL